MNAEVAEQEGSKERRENQELGLELGIPGRLADDFVLCLFPVGCGCVSVAVNRHSPRDAQ